MIEDDEAAVPIEPDDGPIREHEMSWGDRLLVERLTLSPRHKKLAELAAQGLSNKEIAEQLNYTGSRVSILLTNTNIKREIEKIRERVFLEPMSKRLKHMGDLAADEIERCLTDNTNKYKESLKVETAKWVAEKIDGKAIQRHDIGENILAVMMDRLDSLKSSGQSSLIPPEPAQKTQIDATDAEFHEIPAEEVPKTEEDLLKDWCLTFDPAKKG